MYKLISLKEQGRFSQCFLRFRHVWIWFGKFNLILYWGTLLSLKKTIYWQDTVTVSALIRLILSYNYNGNGNCITYFLKCNVTEKLKSIGTKVFTSLKCEISWECGVIIRNNLAWVKGLRWNFLRILCVYANYRPCYAERNYKSKNYLVFNFSSFFLYTAIQLEK